ncbi:MAG TPA: hypothetical protein P5528_15490 [Steroidobacteraceae bacterium]|nr:hypothetical protein [Steroidobacteraceae bacterium]
MTIGLQRDHAAELSGLKVRSVDRVAAELELGVALARSGRSADVAVRWLQNAIDKQRDPALTHAAVALVELTRKRPAVSDAALQKALAAERARNACYFIPARQSIDEYIADLEAKVSAKPAGQAADAAVP